MRFLSKLLVLFIVLLCAAMLFAATDYYRVENAGPQTILPMTFAHADHRRQQCVSCHHNYQDDSGQGLCLDCHRTDPDVSHLFREQFHGLCMGCHTETRSDFQSAGPLRSCAACHTADDAP